MSENKIEVGDRVTVCFIPNELEGAAQIEGEVLHIACDVGDCWRIKKDDGTLIYVQHFECIIREPLVEAQNCGKKEGGRRKSGIPEI